MIFLKKPSLKIDHHISGYVINNANHFTYKENKCMNT